MKKSLAIGKYIVKESLSNKILKGFIVFALIILFGTLILKEMTIFNGETVVKDTGIFLMEFFVFLVTVFSASTYLIRDHKEKSIYLVLTKPVSRTEYIIGNVLGNSALALIYILIMTFILEGALLYIGSSLNLVDLISILYIFGKLLILCSLGVLFAVISDSYVTANIFTFSVYIIGHFTGDLLLLVEKSGNPLIKALLAVLKIILPRYNTLNYRDFLLDIKPNHLSLILYIFSYTILVTVISSVIFEKRKL